MDKVFKDSELFRSKEGRFLQSIDTMSAADSWCPGVRQHFACKAERSEILPIASMVPDIRWNFKV